MSIRKKRIYDSTGRQAQASETRKRILEAAKKLFQEEGFDKVTIDRIAREAGVSSPSIYGLFESKSGVLRAIMDEVLPVDQYQSLISQINGDKSPEKRFMIAAKIARKMYDAELAQMDLFRGAPVLSTEFKELEIERETRRHQRQAESMKAIQDSLNMDLAKAHDIVWAFTGRDFYRMLVIERGWSSDDYEKWLGQLLINTLLK